VARRHGLHTSLLFRWRRDLAKRTRSASASPEQSFLPVRLPPPSVPVPVPQAATRSGTIKVVLAGGRTLRVGADVDTVTLLRIVEALEAHR
jgi:transposase